VGTGSTLADYAASIAPGLPYWVVAASGGTLTVTADSNASGGFALKSTCTAGGQTNRVYQDIPVTAGETLRVIRNTAITRTAADVSVNVYVSWRDSTHAIIGTRFGGGLNYTATAAYWQSTDYPISPLVAPANASYLRYELEFVHNTGTGTTVWISDVAMKDTVFPVSAAASGTITLTTSLADITGATITLPPGNYWVHATIDFDITVAGNTTVVGVLSLDGVAQAAQMLIRPGTTAAGTAGRWTVSQSWLITVAQGAAGVAKLRANKVANVNTSTAGGGHTTIQAIPIP
jgi:hypothetical protein